MKYKRIIVALVCIIMTAFPFILSACSNANKDILVIYNWEDYIDELVNESFKEYYHQETGRELNIIYSTFDTNETMVTKVINNDANVDLICPSEYAIQKLMVYDRLHKLNLDNIPNFKNVDPNISSSIGDIFSQIPVNDEVRDMRNYFAPYMWGTLGILYNADVVTEADLQKGWGLLWNEGNNASLQGKILMKDSIRDAYVASLLYAKEYGRLPDKYQSMHVGELINTVDDELLNISKAVLSEQKKHLKGYEVDFGKDDMIAKKAYVNLAWSGDAMYAIEEAEDSGVNLDYFVPEVGGNIWFDGWIIPSNSKNIDIAEMYINYMLQPDISMMNTMYIGYNCAIDPQILMNNEDALVILADNEYDADEFFADERRYPTNRENLGVMQDFGKANSQVVAMWESVKAESENMFGILFVIIAVIIGLIGVFVLIGVAKDYFGGKYRVIENSDNEDNITNSYNKGR